MSQEFVLLELWKVCDIQYLYEEEVRRMITRVYLEYDRSGRFTGFSISKHGASNSATNDMLSVFVSRKGLLVSNPEKKL